MHKIYQDKGQFNFIYQLPQIIYSYIISKIIDTLLKYFALSQDIIIELKEINSKYVDKYMPFDVYDEKIVMSDELVYKDKKEYLNGVSLNVGKNYNINSLCGGIVVYIGDKEKLGNTVIIQGTDGVDYWYSNIDNLSVKLYDYIEKDTLIGTSVNDNIYLTFVKNGEYINYEEFI